MPVARKLDRQVSAAPLPGARRSAAATPESEGAGVQAARARVGQAVAGIGETVAGAGLKLLSMDYDARLREELQARRRADQLAVLEYDNALDRWELENVHGQNGALSKKGKAAFALPEETDRAFDAYAGEQAQVLITDEQKLGAARIRAERRQRIALTVRRHVDNEFRTFTAEQLQAKIDLTVESAQHNAMDPGLVKQDIRRGVDYVRELGQFAGASPEQVEKQIGAFKSSIHLGVIDRLLADQQTTAARLYFEESQSEIAGDKLDDVKRALRAGSVKGEAQKRFDDILAAGGTYADQVKKARAITDPDVRDAVENYIDHQRTQDERAEREANEARSKSLYDKLEKNGGNIRGIMGTREWAQLPGNERRSLQIYAEALTGGTDVKTDQKAFYGLVQQAMSDPSTFARMDLWPFKGKLSGGDFQQVAGWQMSIRNGERNKVDQIEQSFASPTQLYTRALKEMGIKDDSEQGIALWRRFLDASSTEARLTGKKLTDQDLQGILDRLIIEIPNPAAVWYIPGDSTKRGFEATIDDIPQAMRQQIVDALRKNSVPVNNDTILDTWLRYQQGQKK